MFEMVIEELKKANKEANSVVQLDNNRYIPNAQLNRTS